MCKRNNEWNEIMKFKNELTKIKHIAFVLPYVKHELLFYCIKHLINND